MKHILKAVMILLTGFMFLQTSFAAAKPCEVNGVTLTTKGHVSCRHAKKIYKIYMSNKKLPKGWVCTASTNECVNDKKKTSFEFSKNK